MFALLLHAGNLGHSSNGRAIDQSWTLLHWLAKTQALAGAPLKVGQGKRPHWVGSCRLLPPINMPNICQPLVSDIIMSGRTDTAEQSTPTGRARAH